MATQGFITPILEEFQTIFRATLNTEKDLIDSTLDDVATEAIVIEDFENWAEICPMVQIWVVPSEHPLQAEDTGANNINPLWDIITTCIVQADNDETLINNLDTYLTAILHSAAKGQTNAWGLDGEADFLIPQSMSFTDVFSIKDTNKITQKGGITWTVDKEYTIT